MSDRNELKATLATLASSHAHLDQAHRSPRCMHVRTNGVRCGSPAMRRNAFCFFHDRYYNAPARKPPAAVPDSLGTPPSAPRQPSAERNGSLKTAFRQR